MHVLIVEDDREIARFLADGLVSLGHSTNVVETGEGALARLDQTHFDAMVLDRLLPGTDGLEVIRRKSCDVPVLMVSALGTLDHRVAGLNAGADDYLTKPFEIVEVEARLNAIVRRHTPADRTDLLRVGDIEISLTAIKAMRQGRYVPLNKKEFGLLAELARYPDRVVTRRMLIEAVWGYSFDPPTNIVESNMSRLRTKLAFADGDDPIKTVRGVGYVLRSTPQ